MSKHSAYRQWALNKCFFCPEFSSGAVERILTWKSEVALTDILKFASFVTVSKEYNSASSAKMDVIKQTSGGREDFVR